MPIIETKDLTYTYGEGTPFCKTAVSHATKYNCVLTKDCWQTITLG